MYGIDILRWIKSRAMHAKGAFSSHEKVYRFRDYEIPIDLLNLTGGGADTFEVISDGHIAHLQRTIGIERHHQLLEVGCGIGRDAIPLTEIISSPGSYIGVDIIKRSVDWCSANITKKNPHFRFFHFDIMDQLHNPHGKRHIDEYVFPIEDESIDRVFLWSVFTHMFEKDILWYLKEFKRILKQDGLIFSTTFIVSAEIIRLAQATNLTPHQLRFEYAWGDGCFVNDIHAPTGAVAYTAAALERMWIRAGLRLARPIQYGSWSGFHEAPDGYGQDGIVLGK